MGDEQVPVAVEAGPVVVEVVVVNVVAVVVGAVVVLVVPVAAPGFSISPFQIYLRAVNLPEKAQVHSLEMALGLLEQYVAHAGRAVVAVTVD